MRVPCSVNVTAAIGALTSEVTALRRTIAVLAESLAARDTRVTDLAGLLKDSRRSGERPDCAVLEGTPQRGARAPRPPVLHGPRPPGQGLATWPHHPPGLTSPG